MKKLFALLLCLAMVLGMLSGCGGTAAEAAPTASAPEVISAPEEATETVEAAEEAETEEKASEAEDIPEAAFDIYGPFSEEPITLTYWKLWPPFLEGFDPGKLPCSQHSKKR